MNSKTGYQKSIVEDLEYATTDLIFKFKEILLRFPNYLFDMCENVVILLSVYIPQALFEKTLPLFVFFKFYF
jgi:hypothetical protein